MGLCRDGADPFIKEKTCWVVTLSNGETIYQDDDRPNEEEPKAWRRLKKYVETNHLAITSFRLQFFTHSEEVAPPNAQSYYFVQGVASVLFVPESLLKYYVIGYMMPGESEFTVTHWNVPAIVPIRHEKRPMIDPNDDKVITCRNVLSV